ncbi:methyltransferase, FkbM family [Lentzea albidocapillata subsp. violacea]|uniref:Methyltransferase, FkbM family n=1 Tax=Lentzea albidocapillata subsp. violacea TaxID=128104 RepID=A0A1G9JK00_9PSEU|nr:FkbM family methyltransferase [Lentzea albidocapillata]SDL37576.1 methyltransferase, FkbM family [Lentzea albidocapillata subsp. violacea]
MLIDPGEVAGVNRHETEYLYDEIVVRRAYLPPGVELPPGSVVLDVGANIGMYSLFARSECPTASIYAFEPLPPLLEKLRANVSAHDVTVLPYGLSDADREVSFVYYPGYSTMSTQYADTALEKRYIRDRLSEVDYDAELLGELLDFRFREQTFGCRVRRLSGVIDELGLPRVDMVKIDVQRAELDVLRGIEERHWPMLHRLVLEVHDEAGTPTAGRLAPTTGMLRNKGFDVTVREDPGGRHTVFAVRRPA